MIKAYLHYYKIRLIIFLYRLFLLTGMVNIETLIDWLEEMADAECDAAERLEKRIWELEAAENT